MLSASVQITALLLSSFLYYLLSRWKATRNLPPGPRSLPIVGNILDLPPSGMPEYQHWAKFRERYGPVSSLTVLGTTLVIIQCERAVQEILIKTSSKSSGRPHLHFANDMCGLGGLTPNLTHNSMHRLHRKLMHQTMGTKNLVQKFYGIQDVESRRFLLRVLDDPDNVIAHIKTYVADLLIASGTGQARPGLLTCRSEASAIILRIAYGYSIEPHKVDPLVTLIERMMDNFSNAFVPMSWMVDILPFTEHLPSGFPGTSFKKKAQQWKEVTRMAAEIPYAFTVQQVSDAKNRESYVSALIDQGYDEEGQPWKPSREDEEAIKNSAAIIYGGGADTTVSTISSFVLAMMLYPNVQRRAQAEIDRVVGTNLPEFEDRERLPYVRALVKETMRWLPVVPIGTTHMADEEITYDGYRIPKGAYLLPSIWWFLHDPQVHPNPSSFDPERFLEPRNEPDPANHAFGYGRRICPGRHLAEDSLFLTISRFLSVFRVKKAIDDKGAEIDVKVDVTPGLISHPVKFPFRIEPRSIQHAELIRSSEIEYPWEEGDSRHLGEDHLKYLADY